MCFVFFQLTFPVQTITSNGPTKSNSSTIHKNYDQLLSVLPITQSNKLQGIYSFILLSSTIHTQTHIGADVLTTTNYNELPHLTNTCSKLQFIGLSNTTKIFLI